MKVRVFGALTQVLQDREQPLEHPLTVGEFMKRLREEHPRLNAYTFRVALNQKMAADDDILHEEDELALLPPFAGG